MKLHQLIDLVTVVVLIINILIGFHDGNSPQILGWVAAFCFKMQYIIYRIERGDYFDKPTNTFKVEKNA